MGKSLMDYNIEQSSSSDIKNIKWTQKNPSEPKKQKKKRNKISPTNTIPVKESKRNQPAHKVFKIEENINSSKKNKIKKRVQNSSLDNCKIEQGWKRKAR